MSATRARDALARCTVETDDSTLSPTAARAADHVRGQIPAVALPASSNVTDVMQVLNTLATVGDYCTDLIRENERLKAESHAHQRDLDAVRRVFGVAAP